MPRLNKIEQALAHWRDFSAYAYIYLGLFTLIPLSALAYHWAGQTGFAIAALLLPSLALMLGRRPQTMVTRVNGDGLTGLPTPSQMDDMIRPWVAQMQQTQKKTASFVIQVDRFPDFLATYGETAGFHLQRTLAERIQRVMRDEDVVARIGDATYNCMLFPVRHLDLEICIHMANRIKGALESPMLIDAASVRITVSVGFCISGQMKSGELSALEEGASIALGAAQRTNRSSIRAFSPALLEKHQNRKSFCEEARDALRNKEVVAWYQPQISTETGVVTGFEMLARWRHPQKGIMPPGEFLDTLAESGQLELLSEEMLSQGLQALAQWDRARLNVPHVGINFSGDELHNPMLADRIQWELERFETAPNRLAVEVLESVIAGAPDGVVARNLNKLSKLGVHIDLDDFGTGHAAISSVQRFSAQRLKIDRSFVKGVDQDQNQQKLIAAIVTMAEQLGLTTLAEGVETPGEHEMLSQLGCAHVQGFGIARPMPFEDTIAWMQAHIKKLPTPPFVGKISE